MRHCFVLVLFLFSSSMVYAQAQRVVSVFPQFASGGGWSSDFFIDNQGGVAATVDLSFYDDKGEALTVDSTLGVGSTFSFSLNGGNTKIVRVSSGSAVRTGYVVLSFPSGASVRASEVFRYEQNGAVIAALGVSQQFPGTSFSFPAEVDAGRRVNTALAIANGTFGSTPSTVQYCIISLIKSDGTLQATASVKFGPGEHNSTYLNAASLFPGLDGFSGVVSVSAARPFGLVVLRQEQAAFGTVSVDTGPVVAPFLLNMPTTAEVEPNNSRATAHRINNPTVISGIIAFAGDVDYFQFTGKRGEIVTAVVSTAALNSDLDSILFLLNSEGTVIAENDENGLFYQNDSFIQAGLPADGTYYLAVTDFQNRGGITGTYRLHFQLLTP